MYNIGGGNGRRGERNLPEQTITGYSELLEISGI